jgi:nucleoside-diphosphate-sugar epimerase
MLSNKILKKIMKTGNITHSCNEYQEMLKDILKNIQQLKMYDFIQELDSNSFNNDLEKRYIQLNAKIIFNCLLDSTIFMLFKWDSNYIVPDKEIKNNFIVASNRQAERFISSIKQQLNKNRNMRLIVIISFYKIAWDLITKPSTTEQVSYHKANITNLDELTPHFKEIDAVFHTAALIDVDGPRSSLLNINLLGTQNVVECCLKNNVMAFIFTSSISVNQPTTEKFNYKETSSEYKFIESYGESKRYAEELVLNANGIHGLYTAAFATIGLWGPHDPLFFNPVIKMKNPLAKIPRFDEAIQTPCFCENAAHAQSWVLKKLKSPMETNIVADEPIQSSEMKVNLWEAFHGKKAEFKIIPNGIFVTMTYILHYVRWWLQPVLEFKPPVRKSYLIYSASLTLDISKIQKELGYKPLYTNKEAIKRSIEVYKSKIEKK